MAFLDRTRALKKLQSSCMPGSLRFRFPSQIEDRDRQPRLARIRTSLNAQLPFSISETDACTGRLRDLPTCAGPPGRLTGATPSRWRLGIREAAHERRSRSICRHERLQENAPSMSRRFRPFNRPGSRSSAIAPDSRLFRRPLRARRDLSRTGKFDRVLRLDEVIRTGRQCMEERLALAHVQPI